jgi:hypothetical protein
MTCNSLTLFPCGNIKKNAWYSVPQNGKTHVLAPPEIILTLLVTSNCVIIYNFITTHKASKQEQLYLVFKLRIFKVIKSRGMRWAGHVTRVGSIGNACKIIVGKHGGKIHLENSEVDGKIILECMEWMNLAKYRDQWRALLNSVMKFQVL